MAGSILIAGATGLVGRHCLRRAVGDASFDRVTALVRRPLPPELLALDDGRKLEQRVVDFERLDEHADVLAVDHILCALGTTIKKAGTRERFRRVDLEYPLALARLGLGRGARHYQLVSAMSASSTSRFFYSRVKGELEDALREMPFRSLTIARPSLLLGEREEFRLGETLAKPLGFLLPPSVRPVDADAVAEALISAAREDRAGHRILTSREMRRGHSS